MLRYEYHSMIEIPTEDEVVAVITFRDYVLVITRKGRVYKIREDEF